jgi:hypothetical protein
LPLPALDAVSLNCAVQTACAADGACMDGAGRHSLRLRPIFARDDGSTRLEIEIDGQLRDGSAVTDAGPILWIEGQDDLQTVLLLNDGAALWHRRDARSNSTCILFMTCTEAS